jgi:DNA-binding protein HU-beta
MADGMIGIGVQPGVNTKADVVAAIADRAGMTKADAERWLSAFSEFLTEALGRGEMIKLTGLFELMRVKRAARMGRNLQTGEEIEIPESWGVRFKPGSMLKNAVKSDYQGG